MLKYMQELVTNYFYDIFADKNCKSIYSRKNNELINDLLLRAI